MLVRAVKRKMDVVRRKLGPIFKDGDCGIAVVMTVAVSACETRI